MSVYEDIPEEPDRRTEDHTKNLPRGWETTNETVMLSGGDATEWIEAETWQSLEESR